MYKRLENGKAGFEVMTMADMPLEIEMPLGLGMAMAQFPAAMECYAALPEEKRRELIERARSARTRKEMRACVDELLRK